MNTRDEVKSINSVIKTAIKEGVPL